MAHLTLLSRSVSATSRLLGRRVANLCVAIFYVMLGLLVTKVLMWYFLGAPQAGPRNWPSSCLPSSCCCVRRSGCVNSHMS